MFDVIKKNRFLISSTLVLVTFLVTLTIFSFKESYSLSDEDKWDGVSISDSFDSGIGTKENPYLISSSAQFLYFKKVIEEENDFFSNKYYKLTTNINLSDNTIDPIGDEVNYFKGNFDGDGFSIYNFKIEDIEDNYYGLFSRIDGSISNLNLRNITISPNNKEGNNDALLENNISNEEFIAEDENSNSIEQTEAIEEDDSNILDTNLEEEQNEQLVEEVEQKVEENVQSNANGEDVSLGVTNGNNISVGILAGEVSSNNANNISNISIVDSKINLDNVLFNEDSRIGGLFGYINKNINVKNIYLDYEFVGNISTSVAKVISINEGNVENVILRLSGVDINSIKNFNNLDLDVFTNVDNGYKLGDKDYTINQLLSEVNNKNKGYYWEYEEDNFIVYKYLEPVAAVGYSAKLFMFSATATALHETGIDGSTVYINDLDADRAHFEGLNYTDRTSTGSLPDGSSSNDYNDSNLVQVTVTYKGGNVYSGVDYNYSGSDNQEGRVGPETTEKDVSTFVYYKVYKASGSSVTIELIDHPYGVRPNDMGFNGWVTDYEGATVSLDSDIYVRNATIPVTYTDGKPNPIDITFYATWIPATTYETYLSSDDSDLDDELDDHLDGAGLKYIDWKHREWDIVDAYYLGEKVEVSTSGAQYPANSYDSSGNPLTGDCPYACNLFGGSGTVRRCCPAGSYYRQNVDGATNYNSSKTYYRLVGGTMTSYTPSTWLTENSGSPLIRGNSAAGLYRSNGTLIQGNSGETIDINSDYYYMVTRDTNIVVVRDYTYHPVISSNPMTITSVNNGTDYKGTIRLYAHGVENSNIRSNADLRVEYVNMISKESPSGDFLDIAAFSNSDGFIYGNYHNLKVGRGIVIPSDGSVNAKGVIAGNVDRNDATYRLIVESGRYNIISLSGGNDSDTNKDSYLSGTAIYGSDYDRANNNDNLKLQVYFSTASNFGTKIGSSSSYNPSFNTIIKSGDFGYGKENWSYGVYAGGRTGVGGSADNINETPVSVTVEGGKIHSLVGGDLFENVFKKGDENTNSVYINIKGDEKNYPIIDHVFGGASDTGEQDTYGNRIINITGGKVNYSVFGGNNSWGRDVVDTWITGSTFVYINSTAVIGDMNKSSQYGITPGNVYAAGNGINNTKILSDEYYNTHVSNSCNIYIKGGTINGSVFGAGTRNGTANNVTIDISGDNTIIGGSVYGAGNNESFSDAPVIHIRGGTIGSGNIYGGGIDSNIGDSGRKGSATVNVYTSYGKPINNIYGGSYVNSNSDVIVDKSEINIYSGINVTNVYGGNYNGGVASNTNIKINGGSVTNLYGGNNGGGNAINTNVNINGGNVDSVYGGGYRSPIGNVTVSSSTYSTSPGNTNVNISSGNVKNVYGGGYESNVGYVTSVTLRDSEGNSYVTTATIGGNTNVNVTGGTISSSVVYGGSYKGNVNTKSTVNISNVNLGNVYGGSHESGTASNSLVNINSGTVGTLYGGNNSDGVVNNTEVNVKGGTVGTLYGGNDSSGRVTNTSVNVSGGAVTTLFASGKGTDTTNSTSVSVSGGNVGTLYGGSNSTNTTPTTTITASGGTIGEVFGGGTGSNTSGRSSITLSGSTVNNAVYGGGNGAGFGQTEINLTGGSVPVVYGGSKTSGTVTGTDIEVGTGSACYNDSNTVIYGGGNGAAVSGATSITTNCGTVKTIYGGGQNSSIGSSIIEISDTTVSDSVYGGGYNGDVNGSTVIRVNGTSIINKNIFGGSKDASVNVSTVNIAGGHIKGNVYGEGDGSAAWVGLSTSVNIGKESTSSDILGNVIIEGNVYGNLDSSRSLAEININILGELYNSSGYKLLLGGNLIGNSSDSDQTSTIDILNYGIKGDPSKILSIKNTDTVTVDNSIIELGSTDINSNVSDYSFNNVFELIVENGTYLHLQKNVNNLSSFASMIGDEYASGINSEDGVNRLYLKVGTNLEIKDDVSYGLVSGMTFAGMYDVYKDGTYRYGIFDEEIDDGDECNEFYEVVGVSTISGISDSDNHEKDGFYTNYLNDDYKTISVNYIEMIDKNDTTLGDYNEWVVYVRPTVVYDFDLIASKYSSLGTYSLSLDDFVVEDTREGFDGFKNGSTTFDVVGVNVQKIDANLLFPSFIKKIADSADFADNNFGLEMRSESFRWKEYNDTQILTADQGSVLGAISHYTYEPTYEDINGQVSDVVAPSLDFYLYHSKNISSDGNVGAAVIYLLTKTLDGDEVRNEFVAINVNIGRELGEVIPAYDAGITYGKKYEIPVTTSVNITNKSQFTAYFSLYNSLFNGYESKYHVLKTIKQLPSNTQITMIDFSNSSQPKYYYYTVGDDFTLDSDNKYIYKLSDFIKMGSIDSKFEETNSNYILDDDTIMEEFLFIFDFKNSIYDTDDIELYSNRISFELIDGVNDSIKVLTEKEEVMDVNLYGGTSDIEFDSLFSKVPDDSDINIRYDEVHTIDFTSKVVYKTTYLNDVINTNLETGKIGLNIMLYKDGKKVSAENLLGTKITIDGINYGCGGDGVFRIKLSDRLDNLSKTIDFSVAEFLDPGKYTFKFVLFASSNGYHDSSNVYFAPTELDYTVVGNDNYILVDSEDETKVINGNLNDVITNSYNIKAKYESYIDGKVIVKLFKKDNMLGSTKYDQVDIKNIFDVSSEDNVVSFVLDGYTGDYDIIPLDLKFKNNLTSGTYRLEFGLYNGNDLIDEVYKYVIIKKSIIDE